MSSSHSQRVELPLTADPSQEPAAAATGASSSLPASAVNLDPVQIQELGEKIVAALRTCYDPEIPVNIHELGLIYEIDVSPAAAVAVRMTLTSPACPAAGSLPPEVRRKVEEIPGVTSARVDVVWDPPWDQNMMSEAAKLQLGIYDY